MRLYQPIMLCYVKNNSNILHYIKFSDYIGHIC